MFRVDTVALEMHVEHYNTGGKAPFSMSEKVRPNSTLLEKSPYLPQRCFEECAKIAAVDVLLTRKMQLHNSIFLVLLQCCVGNKTIPIELKAISRAVKMPLDLVSFVQRQKRSFLTAKVCNLI